ncbi:MAG: AAA family ATPase, partial [Synergistales bacterium]|nr:AAA family ATPase [Synergistales bacterium]
YGAVVELPEDREKNTDWDDELRRHGIEPAKALFREAWSKATVKQPETPEEEKPKARLKKFNAVDLYRANLRSPSWAIDQLIPEGLSVVASPPKVGKSYFVLQAAIAVARGVPFLGQRTTKGPVLLLSLEDTEIRLRKRLVQVIPDLRDIPENLDMMTEFPRLDEDGLSILDDEIKRNGYRLVIIDTWGKTKPVGQTKRGENVYETDVRLVSEVKKIADRYETSIILVHHLKKGGSREPDWLESLSGSMGLSATVDGLLAIERDRKAVLGILKRTGRDLEDDEDIGLKWLQPGWEFNGDAREMMQSAARKEILSSIARAKEPVTPKYVVLDTGGKDSTIRVHLMNMKNAGLVAVTSDGKYYIPQKEEPSDDNAYPVNSLNALNGLNAVNGLNGLNGLNVYGAEGTLNAPVNAINASDTNDSDGSVYGVYGVYDKRTTGNLEPFFPGGLKTGLSIPRGYSVSDLASRAGVSVEAVQEELSRWEECKRVSLDGDKIILLEGDSYPGQDEP